MPVISCLVGEVAMPCWDSLKYDEAKKIFAQYDVKYVTVKSKDQKDQLLKERGQTGPQGYPVACRRVIYEDDLISACQIN